MDEKSDRIYLLTVDGDIMVYDFSGNFYQRIPVLAAPPLFGTSIKVETAKRDILVSQPPRLNETYSMWYQNFDGSLIKGVKTEDYYQVDVNHVSTSRSSLTNFRNGVITYFRFDIENGNDYLYHFEKSANRFIPKFQTKSNNPLFSFNFVFEFSNYYMVEASQEVIDDNPGSTQKIIIDKETLRGCLFESFMTPYGISIGRYAMFNSMAGEKFSLLEFGSFLQPAIDRADPSKMSKSELALFNQLKQLVEEDGDEDCTLVFIGDFK